MLHQHLKNLENKFLKTSRCVAKATTEFPVIYYDSNVLKKMKQMRIAL